MRRRRFNAMAWMFGVSLLVRPLVRHGFAATNQADPGSVKGKLVENKDAPSLLRTDDGKTVTLAGDEDSQKVLHDPRLDGMQLEAIGHFSAPDQFTLDPRF